METVLRTNWIKILDEWLGCIGTNYTYEMHSPTGSTTPPSILNIKIILPSLAKLYRTPPLKFSLRYSLFTGDSCKLPPLLHHLPHLCLRVLFEVAHAVLPVLTCTVGGI